MHWYREVTEHVPTHTVLNVNMCAADCSFVLKASVLLILLNVKISTFQAVVKKKY